MQDDFEDGETGLPDDVSGGGDLQDMEPGGDGDVEIDLDSALPPGSRPSGGARAVARKSGGGGRKSGPSTPAKKVAAKPAKKAMKSAKKAAKPAKKAAKPMKKASRKAGKAGKKKGGRR